MDWDTLAYEIILMENAIFSQEYTKEKVNLFKKYLKSLEQEKEIRVHNAFDFETFLSRDYEEFDVEYEDSDI